MTWRTLSIVLATLLLVQTWRSCNRSCPAPTNAGVECTDTPTVIHRSANHPSDRDTTTTHDDIDAEEVSPSNLTGPSINGFRLPAWTMWFAPQPGESLLSYRDRMVPLAQAAVAPHRARVARGRDDFAKQVDLDSQQRAELDAAVSEAQTQIQDKVMTSLMSGELAPKHFKPMTGVSLARDVLDSVDRANQRFMATLREDQRVKLGQHPFDFADYLLFSARWEDALGVTN